MVITTDLRQLHCGLSNDPRSSSELPVHGFHGLPFFLDLVRAMKKLRLDLRSSGMLRSTNW